MRKQLALLCSLIFLITIGCADKKLSENDFDLVWRSFIKEELVSAIEKKLSPLEKQKLLNKSAEKYRVDYNKLVSYMKEHHNKKYLKLFITK